MKIKKVLQIGIRTLNVNTKGTFVEWKIGIENLA